ncbi:MAG: hypothetical protein JNK29_02725 [Anaerolineales bacterium]|nr:hypothetical protein [Anaerolineales bacterium]
MAKTFYTERDIDDLHARGVTSLDVHDDIVLTELARERALKLGVRLNRVTPGRHAEDRPDAELIHRVKAAVLARLNGQVDPAVLEAVVTKVVASLKK